MPVLNGTTGIKSFSFFLSFQLWSWHSRIYQIIYLFSTSSGASLCGYTIFQISNSGQTMRFSRFELVNCFLFFFLMNPSIVGLYMQDRQWQEVISTFFFFFVQNEMQTFTTKIVNMAKEAKLFASQGGPIILAQVRRLPAIFFNPQYF